MKLAIAALSIGMMFSNVHSTAVKPRQEPKATKPAPVAPAPAPTFDQQYFAQVDRVNVALEVYGNTPCTKIGFRDAESSLEKEYNALLDLYHNIPDSEPVLEQTKQIEITLGINQVARDLIQMQNDCLKDHAPVQYKEYNPANDIGTL